MLMNTDLPKTWQSLAHAFLHEARKHPSTLAVCDSLGETLTYRDLLVRALVLANHLKHHLDDSICVGVLLPPSAAAVTANLALAFLGKVSVNLNYRSQQSVLDSCIEKCNLKNVITAGSVIKKLQLDLKGCLLMDDIKEDVSFLAKAESFLEALLLPETLLESIFSGLSDSKNIDLSVLGISKKLSHNSTRLDQPATIIFTAGSTKAPKGVVLSHRNILSNIHAISQQGQIKKGEVVLGVIPFFHSFGLTMTLWAPLCLGETAVFHYDPFDGRRIARLCQDFSATCLVCTPTMMANYLKRCSGSEFKSLRNCLLGGEKLRRQTANLVKMEIGITPVEGYGLAETSPVVTCNVPNPVRLADGRLIDGNRLGTVGLPIPGTTIKIVSLESHDELPQRESGLVFVSGPQIMLGYLNDEEESNRVMQDGWFNTGDIGFLDEDGFLTITGRKSQFSKIAGEMVSHIAVEEEILKVLNLSAGSVSITSLPDKARGERLIAVFASANINKTAEQIVEELKSSPMPKLWIPKEDDIVFVETLPSLPNGKLDLRKIKDFAVQSFH